MGLIPVRRALAAILAAGALWSCTPAKIVGRYKSALCQTAGSQAVSCASVMPKASAYAVSIGTPQSSSNLSAASLPDRALAAYIKALANPKLSSSAADLRSNLAARLSAPASSGAGVDVRTVFHRTLIVTVRKEGGFNPADRLEATDVAIKLANARFESWDTLATAYTTINAGTMQLTQQRGATEKIAASPPGTAPVSASAALEASQSNTLVENYTAAIQAETLTATIEQDGRTLVIHRQGGSNIDLTGNTVIKVVMSYTGASPMFTYAFSVGQYKDSKGKWLPPRKLKIAARPVSAVPPGVAIHAQVTLVYTIRHVLSGDSTYEERDDKVLEYTSAPVTNEVELIAQREASPPWFGLVATAGQPRGFAVMIEQPGAPAAGLCFDSYNEARQFLTYLDAVKPRDPSRIGDSRLGFFVPPGGLIGLTRAGLPALQAQDRCR